MTTRLYLITYFSLLFLVLGLLLFPSFSNPPYVDYWEAFCVFHQVRADPLLSPWPYIVNHDPWRHGTFRPLLYTILYLEHRTFDSSFVWNHITNFFCYCLFLILLFLLGKRLGARPPELAGFLAVFAVLYSHCDILTLTFHVSLLFGLCAITTGFLLYLGYLKRRNGYILFAAGFFFLSGMLCYESLFFYPAGLFILILTPGAERGRRRVLLRTVLLLAVVYILYGTTFLLTRTSDHLSGSIPSIQVGRIATGFFISLSNLLYTGLGVNLCPFIGSPPIYKGYSEMGGAIPIGLPPWLIPAAHGAGIVAMVLIGVGVGALLRKRRRSALVAVIFLLYLNLSFFFFLTTARSTTNNLSHIIRQFRYQLAPNAFLMLVGAVVVSSIFRPSRKNRIVILTLFLSVFLMNIYNTNNHIQNVTAELRPLRNLLKNIRTGIKVGDISPQHRLYIPDAITASFPHLCWNRLMGRKMWGTYQWVFSPAELACFTPYQKEAYWDIDPEGGEYKNR